MKHLSHLLFGFTILLGAQTVLAADAAAGKDKAVVCAACHGSNGMSVMPAYPNLAGQQEAYLVSALRAYRSKDRNGGMSAIMQMQATSLSDDDIDNLAAYFSGLK